MSRIDVLIVNFHTSKSVCDAVARLTPWHDGQIFVIDNSVSELERETLTKELARFPEVSCHFSASNLGFGAACNVGLKASTAEQVLLLNPDAVIEPADIELLSVCLGEQQDLAAIAPSVFWNQQKSFLTPYTVDQNPGAELKAWLSLRLSSIASFFAERSLAQMHSIWHSQQLTSVNYLSAAVVLLKRSALVSASNLIRGTPKKTMIFDPDYFMFFEDSDLSLRLRRSGWKLGVLPTAHAVHEYRHKYFKASMMQTSRQVYFRKRFPVFFQLTRQLEKLRPPDRSVEGSHLHLGSLKYLTQFLQATKSDSVLAWSPSPLMYPLVFRPVNVLSEFSNDEWSLLEPGTYYASLQRPNGQRYTVKWQKL